MLIPCRAGLFLSCLYGSELTLGCPVFKLGFLSCLYGSELVGIAEMGLAFFLSCLYGSEPFRLCHNYLIFKEIPAIHEKYPLFPPSSRVITNQ